MAKKTDEVKRVAIYSRVSTADKEQSTERQIRELRAHAKARGWEVVLEVEEKLSGAAVRKPEREKVLALARKRKIDAVLVLSLDRWSRSTKDLVNTVDELRQLGVMFIAPGKIDMTTAEGRLMAGMLSVIAEFELELIRERVMSGLANARAKGRIGGRPRRNTEDGLALLQQGKSYTEASRETGLSVSTLQRAKRAAKVLDTSNYHIAQRSLHKTYKIC